MKVNITLILIIIILLLIGGMFIGKNYYEGQIAEVNREKRALVLKNDKLEQISETQYRKLLADSLTQKELNKIVDSLKIKLDAKPKIIYKTKIVIEEVEKPIDSISIDGDTVNIVDHYPDKEEPFVTYKNKFSLSTQTGISDWKFTPFNLSIVVSQRSDGIWQTDTQVPDFMTITDITVQGTPQEPPEKRNRFGFILGAGAGQQLLDNTTYYRVETGIRWGKTYLDVGFNTNVSADATLKFEF